MDKKELDNIVYSVGPDAVEIAYIILMQVKEKNVDKLLPVIRKACDDGWLNAATEHAQMHAQVKENTKQMEENTHPILFVADGGLKFGRQNSECPHCDGEIVSSQFCSQLMEAHKDLPYGGVIMCTNNDYVQRQTDGTGECEYEAWLPKPKKQEA